MRINVDVEDNVSGDWRVETFTVEKNDFSNMFSLYKTGRYVSPGTYKRLMYRGSVVMSNTPDEIRDFSNFYRVYARGSILINGLGLGVLLKALLEKPEVTDITVIEKSEDVIKLVADKFKDERVTIIHADAFEYNPPKGKKYDAVWHDIWENICGDNVIEMKRLHRKYARKTFYQDSWCYKKCKKLLKKG